MLELLFGNTPVLQIEGERCRILDFHRLPFSLRREGLSLSDFTSWASRRALSPDRAHAGELLSALHLSQADSFAVCRACRGLSLTDAYWLREEDGLYLYKVGRKELAADAILTLLGIPHLSYEKATEEQKARCLSPSRREWAEGVSEEIVRSKLFILAAKKICLCSSSPRYMQRL